MGDDIPDFHVMKLVLFHVHSSPKNQSLLSHRNGGKGAVRDVIDVKENGCLPLTENWINL
jgi:3-deoxy-D-manno-octulosonate 8-phosphate phosphatase KdsC-like HAD superfamily phosphatase